MPLSAMDWVAVINGTLLLVLTVRQIHGRFFKQEFDGADHEKRIGKLEAGAETLKVEVSRRYHDANEKAHQALLPVQIQGNDHESRIAVLESELGNLKVRVGEIEKWRRR